MRRGERSQNNGQLDVSQQLGPDVAGALPEEFRPLAVRAVGALEGLGVAHLVAEDECDHAAIRIKPGR